MSVDFRRGLPSVDAALRVAGDVTPALRRRLASALREVLADAREGGGPLDAAEALALAQARLARSDAPTLRPVINATGVVLHTNLGRAPLSERAVRAMAEAAGALSLEFELEAGRRGDRQAHAAAMLAELTGAEDAVVANNGAAAVLLALAALAPRKEVLVARGELVEIGGSFRIPDVLARSGARLVEVGTTNRTYLKDYGAAVGPRTGAILRVHASNFRVIGFTARASSGELAALAAERGLAFIHDLGSGTLMDTTRYGLGAEETVPEAIRAGAHVVTFSGDKLLGGPQAGLAVGRADAIARLRSHPLMRAVRPDKVTLAALVATLAAYRDGTAEAELPVWRMIAASQAALTGRARALAAELATAGIGAAVVATSSTVGGGSLPEETQPSQGLALAGRPDEMARRLRDGDLPVVGRIIEDRLVLDLRTVLPEQDALLARALRAALSAAA